RKCASVAAVIVTGLLCLMFYAEQRCSVPRVVRMLPSEVSAVQVQDRSASGDTLLFMAASLSERLCRRYVSEAFPDLVPAGAQAVDVDLAQPLDSNGVPLAWWHPGPVQSSTTWISDP